MRGLPEQLLPVGDLGLERAEAVRKAVKCAIRCGREVNAKPSSLSWAVRSSMLS
jgi:hypothetical protein